MNLRLAFATSLCLSIIAGCDNTPTPSVAPPPEGTPDATKRDDASGKMGPRLSAPVTKIQNN